LYLAESPATAQYYKASLEESALSAMSQKMAAHGVPENLGKKLLSFLYYEKMSPDAATKLLAETRAGQSFGSRLGEIVADVASARPQPGSLYKVDLPDDKIARMLDWDKPLSQQAPEVQKALAKMNPQRQTAEIQAAEKAFDDANYAWMSRPNGLPPAQEKAMSAAAGQAYEAWMQAKGFDGLKGSAIYRKLGDTDKASGEALRQLGIPGIRYLDGGSRGAGQGSYNYVVFPGEEDALTILARNGAKP
jgi:hypothetical protein